METSALAEDSELVLSWRPFLTYLLIIFNVFIYTLQLVNPWITYTLTLIPIEILWMQNLHTLITAMFLHADPLHLFMNMYFFYIFGSAVEREANPFVFLLLYVFSGFCGNLGHILIAMTIEPLFYAYAPFIRTLGSSGAVFGILAAYAYLLPRRRIRFWTGYDDTSRTFMAWNFIILYFILEVVYLFFPSGGISHGAHVFGFIGGYLFAIFYAKIKRALVQLTSDEQDDALS
jgi:membrane associated rhomboid family serine protease